MYSVENNLIYRPRLKIYRSGSAQYKPSAEEAWSYNWCFVKRINGKLVFNNHKYSHTTSNHQGAIKALLGTLGIKIDLYIDSVVSLTGNHQKIGLLAVENAVRDKNFAYAEKIAKLFDIPFTAESVELIIETQEIELCDAYLERAFDYSEGKLKAIIDRLLQGSAQ